MLHLILTYWLAQPLGALFFRSRLQHAQHVGCTAHDDPPFASSSHLLDYGSVELSSHFDKVVGNILIIEV